MLNWTHIFNLHTYIYLVMVGFATRASNAHKKTDRDLGVRENIDSLEKKMLKLTVHLVLKVDTAVDNFWGAGNLFQYYTTSTKNI